MPLRLQELFTWRLKASGADLRVIQVAATVGPTFDAETVSAVGARRRGRTASNPG